jgi:hypothetical protein
MGMANRYGLDGPGSNPSMERSSAPVLTGPGTHPASRTMGRGSLSPWGGGIGRGVALTTHHHLVLSLKKDYIVTSL